MCINYICPKVRLLSLSGTRLLLYKLIIRLEVHTHAWMETDVHSTVLHPLPVRQEPAVVVDHAATPAGLIALAALTTGLLEMKT